MLRTILVPLARGLSSDPALEAAFGIARWMNVHVHCIFVHPDARSMLPYLPVHLASARVMQAELERAGQLSAGLEHATFEGWRSQYRLPNLHENANSDCSCASWSEEVGEFEKVVARYGRVSDLIMISRFQANEPAAERFFDAAVFSTGRPTLLMPEHAPGDLLSHVIVAWNGSVQASRAVFGAMPLLRLAKRVSIFSIPEWKAGTTDTAPLVEALSCHGVSARPSSGVAGPHSVGSALLDVVLASEVSLIVMGAYIHSRLKQEFLGDVTREVLADATVPVLMSY